MPVQNAIYIAHVKKARKTFSNRYGIREFRTLEGELPSGGYIHVELAWVGSAMYELITPHGAESGLCMERLSTDEFFIRHHHLGFLIHDEPA